MRVTVRGSGLCQQVVRPLITYRNVKLFLSALLILSLLFLIFVAISESHALRNQGDNIIDRQSVASKPTDFVEATDVKNLHLHYGIVVDCGSSGSRVYVYFWPPHDGNPKELLNIQQMRDAQAQLVSMKIEPGISDYADKPGQASDYMRPMLNYAAQHVPVSKHKETPLYIMATAGMRMLSSSMQEEILEDLRVDIPLEYNFLFSATHVEVISGKQEGVYAWIGINYALHKFDHIKTGEDEPMVVVTPPGGDNEAIHVRKRTVGMIDMGGGSLQMAFEVPKSEDIAKGLLAEVNLGCTESDTEHVYRLYVTTFLGYGGNIARTRYEALLINKREQDFHSSKHTTKVGSGAYGQTENSALSDPCLPVDMQDTVTYDDRTYYLRGTGNFWACRELQKPLLNQTVPCMKEPCSINGIFQPEISVNNSEFYGFSEFYYSMEDVLRIAGLYDYKKFEQAAQEYCNTKWSVLQEWYNKNYFPKADAKRFRLQCFKSAWIATVLHDGFKFPHGYSRLQSVQLINGKDVQWTLGALVFKTRFFPLREIERYDSHNYRPSWELELSQSYYLLLICLVIVVGAIFLYLRRLRIVRHPDLSRVPTMAYFMTDEGQVEEGLVVDRDQGLPSYGNYGNGHKRSSSFDTAELTIQNEGFNYGGKNFTSSNYYNYSGS